MSKPHPLVAWMPRWLVRSIDKMLGPPPNYAEQVFWEMRQSDSPLWPGAVLGQYISRVRSLEQLPEHAWKVRFVDGTNLTFQLHVADNGKSVKVSGAYTTWADQPESDMI